MLAKLACPDINAYYNHNYDTRNMICFWLRLVPNNKTSDAKLLSSRIPKGTNRLIIALGNAANAIGNLKEFIRV